MSGWLLLALLLPGPALAHGGAPDRPGWTFDPWVVGLLLLAGGVYLGGLGRRRGTAGRPVGRRSAALYLAGWLALAAALVSPLHWWGEHVFTAHMIEHELVMAIAAPLLALARPLGVYLWAFPRPWRRRLAGLARHRALAVPWQLLTSPLPATVWHGAVIWIWHIPLLFDSTITSVPLHRLQHASFLISGLAFWWALARRAGGGTAALHLFATMIHTTLLGALMVLSPRLLYPVQTGGAWRWGLSQLEDQQLAGLIMWVPAGTIYAGAALLFLGAWLKGLEKSHAAV